MYIICDYFMGYKISIVGFVILFCIINRWWKMEINLESRKREKLILQVSYLSIFVNVLLSVFKLVAGIVGNSVSMVSDAVHSISDVLSTFIVIIGVKISNKISDEDHPYGHERLESVMAIVLSILLLIVGLSIGKVGFTNLLNYKILDISIPTKLTLVAALLSILIKEGMYWVTLIISKKVNSSMLKADAWHHRSDALSSVGSLIGIYGARHGYIWLDSLASIIICLFILKIAFDIFKDSVDKLVDKACDSEVVTKYNKIIMSVDGVEHIDDLKTRVFADKVYVDVEICVNGMLTVLEGHEIAENVHNAIESCDNSVKHCTVHVNPINLCRLEC